MVWTTCPNCWGQGRLLRIRDGVAHLALVCPTCLGVGEIAQERSGPAAAA